jgi:phosphoribosylglycinamide formyltransferase-1
MTMRLALFASHEGSTVQAVIDACDTSDGRLVPVLFIGNNADAPAFDRARARGLPTVHLSSATHPDPEDLDSTIRETLLEHDVDLVILAGYMRKLGVETVDTFRNRILNSHPALLPKFGGQGMYGDRVHVAVLESGATTTGATIHIADEYYDHGPILTQRRVRVRPDDTVSTLSRRVMIAESKLYVDTLMKIAAGELKLPVYRQLGMSL